MNDYRMTVFYFPHGGGPWPFVPLPFLKKGEVELLAEYFIDLPNVLRVRPEALLVISAHWETPKPTVMASREPSILYDYRGFPPESYTIQWPAPGNPSLAHRVRDLLSYSGFETEMDENRGFDHGVFIPLKLMYPDASIPTIQLSLMNHLDPLQHLEMGRALAPLRNEGVLILGSGMSYHNLRFLMSDRGRNDSEVFDRWLCETIVMVPEERNRRLLTWTGAPSAREAHPSEEHLLPLMVISGAAGLDCGSVGFNGLFAGTRISAFHFGTAP